MEEEKQETVIKAENPHQRLCQGRGFSISILK